MMAPSDAQAWAEAANDDLPPTCKLCGAGAIDGKIFGSSPAAMPGHVLLMRLCSGCEPADESDATLDAFEAKLAVASAVTVDLFKQLWRPA